MTKTLSTIDLNDLLTTEGKFMDFLKDHSITYNKLKTVLFGHVAKKVIAHVRKNHSFDHIIKNDHHAWYCTKVALTEIIKNER